MDPRRVCVGDLGSHFCAGAGRWLEFCCKTRVLASWELPKGPGWVSQGARGAREEGQNGWVPSSVQSTQREPPPMVCTPPIPPPRVRVG